MPHDVYQALYWASEAAFLAVAPVLLAIRFTRPASMSWGRLLLIAVSIGWVASNLAVYFKFEHLDVLLHEAGGANFAPRDLIDRWQSDGGPRVGALVLGWLRELIYLVPWLAIYGIASAVRAYRPRRPDAEDGHHRPAMSPHELRRAFVAGLEAAARAHESGNLTAIETGYEELEAALAQSAAPDGDQLSIACHFWDGWIDARNHAWLYYAGIEEKDWPSLARIIADDLRHDRPITDARVLRRFDLRPRGSWLWT